MRSVLLLAMSGAISAQTAFAFDLCVGPNRPGCYDKIQDAVDAASPGDKILVFPHPSKKGYNENVVIKTSDLKIIGKYDDGGPDFYHRAAIQKNDIDARLKTASPVASGASTCPPQILDTCETNDSPTSCGGIGFIISAPGVEIHNFTIRHADGAVLIQSVNDVLVENFCVFDSDKAVEGTGKNLRVKYGKILGATRGDTIRLVGENAQVKFNRMINTGGIFLESEHASAVKNYVANSASNQCIEIIGIDARIIGNIVGGCDRNGIFLQGDYSKILHNEVERSPDDADGMDLEGSHLDIGYNVFVLNTDHGLDYDGNFSRIHHNRFRIHGAESNENALSVRGSDNVITSNFVSGGTSAGISNRSGDRNRYEHNFSSRNLKSGIQIASGDSNVVKYNRTFLNQGEGINNDGTNTIIIGNSSFKNRTDICNDGTIAVFSHNEFKTGGPQTSCVVDF